MRSRLLAALALVLLAGCSSAESGTGVLAGSTTTRATSSTAGTSAVPDTPTAGSTTTAGGPAFDTAVITVPGGFQRVSGYYQVVSLEDTAPLMVYLVPTGKTPGLDLISVIVYQLPQPGIAATAAEQIARINSYNSKLSATVIGGIQPTRIGVLGGFTETIRQPGGTSGPKEYKYSTWFAFGRTHVLQVSCQINTPALAAVIARGCNSVLSTVRVTTQ